MNTAIADITKDIVDKLHDRKLPFNDFNVKKVAEKLIDFLDKDINQNVPWENQIELALDDLFPSINKHISSPATLNKSCIHEWALYQGFSQSYEYCKHCDQKKNG